MAVTARMRFYGLLVMVVVVAAATAFSGADRREWNRLCKECLPATIAAKVKCPSVAFSRQGCRFVHSHFAYGVNSHRVTLEILRACFAPLPKVFFALAVLRACVQSRNHGRERRISNGLSGVPLLAHPRLNERPRFGSGCPHNSALLRPSVESQRPAQQSD